jgi:hypothetical protein
VFSVQKGMSALPQEGARRASGAEAATFTHVTISNSIARARTNNFHINLQVIRKSPRDSKRLFFRLLPAGRAVGILPMRDVVSGASV